MQSQLQWKVDFWKAFAPFEAELWLMLLVALILTVVLLWVFEGAKNDQFSRGGWGKRHRTIARVSTVPVVSALPYPAVPCRAMTRERGEGAVELS